MKFLMKGLSATLLIASMSTVAFADGYYKDAMPCPRLMGGWYVGAQGGYDTFKVDETVTVAGVLNADPEIAAHGFAGGLFAGYGQYWNAFYLGGELYINTSGADHSWNGFSAAGVAYTSNFEANTSYGINLLPGMRLNNTTTGFVKLGYNRVDVEQRNTVAAGATVKKSDDMNGFSYGLGMETLLSGNWSMRMDYTHYNLDTVTNVITATTSNKIDVTDNQVMVGVVYHIA